MKLALKALFAAALALAVAGPSVAQGATEAQDAASAAADSSALFADSAAPAKGEAQAAAAPAAGDFLLGLSGSHEFGYHLPAYTNDTRDYDSEMKAPYFSNELGLSVRDKDLKLVSNLEVLLKPFAADSTNEYGSYDGSWSDLVKVKALDNYVSWSPAGWKLSAGYQTFSWGVADKKNPTDNLNPRDYSVGVNADKIPVLAADAVWYPADGFSVEGVFLPMAQSSIYPVDFGGMIGAGTAELDAALTAAYSAKATAIARAQGLPSFLSVNYKVESGDPAYEELDFKPGNSIAGGKLNYRSSAFDASLSYLYDIDPLYTPIVSVKSVKNSLVSYEDSVSIELERERIHRFGMDFKTTLGKYGLWTEACYSLTRNSGSADDYEYRRSKLDYVLGGDASFGPNEVVYVNLQYFGTWIPGYDDSFYADLEDGSITDTQEIYQRALVENLGLETEGLLQGMTANLKCELLNGTLTPQVTAVYAVPFQYDDTNEKRYGSLALNPELDIKPVDSFHIKLGADLAYAWIKPDGESVRLDDSDDKIGVYSPSNNVYLKILYKWNYDLKK
jgi:hypothetical protein